MKIMFKTTVSPFKKCEKQRERKHGFTKIVSWPRKKPLNLTTKSTFLIHSAVYSEWHHFMRKLAHLMNVESQLIWSWDLSRYGFRSMNKGCKSHGGIRRECFKANIKVLIFKAMISRIGEFLHLQTSFCLRTNKNLSMGSWYTLDFTNF